MPKRPARARALRSGSHSRGLLGYSSTADRLSVSAIPSEQQYPKALDLVVSVQEAVTRSIRDAILKGAFPQGHHLMQDDLATQFGVSRQPVREALRRLESEGLVRHLPQRGSVVRSFSLDEIRENYLLRETLESLAAEYAATRITDAELQRLDIANLAMMSAIEDGDHYRITEFNHQVHSIIHVAARLPNLMRLIDQVWIGVTVLTPLFVPGATVKSFHEHELVIGHLRAGQADKAAAAMRKHVLRAADEYFARLRNQDLSSQATQ